MFALLISAALAALLGAAPAAPDEPRARADVLVAEGARLGDAGRWEEAVGRFKDAERLYPRAIHHCNIGLVYVRWKRYPEAQLHLARCRSRATEPLPAWVDVRQREVMAVLSGGDFAPLQITTEPSAARVAIDRFPGEELSAPALVWLPAGRHRVQVSAPGHLAAELEVEVAGGGLLRRNIELTPEPPPEPEPEPEPPPEPSVVLPAPTAPPPAAPAAPPRPVARRTGIALLSLAGASLAGGVGLHLVASSTRSDAAKLPAGAAFDAKDAAFKRQRAGAAALYAVAGATAVGGLIAVLVARSPAAAELGVAPLPRGAVAVVSGRW